MRLRHLLIIAVLSLLPALARAQGGQVTLIRSSVEPLPNCTPAVAGQPEPQIWDITANQVKYCTATNTWTGASTPTLFYQTVLANASAVAQEPKLNFINGSGMTITCADNPGSTRTDCTFVSSVTAATAFSALTASINSNAGTFGFSGNTFDLTNAAAFNLPKVGFVVPGGTSGATTFLPPATGTQTIQIPAAGGTLAVSALGPIVLNASGQISCPTCSTGTGSLSSVGLTQTGSFFNITNSPLTANGNINIALASAIANTVLAAPNGVAGVPTMRALVGADIPAINLATSGAGGVTGLLGKANNLATAVYTDQANTYSAGAQNFAGAASFTVPSAATISSLLSGQLAYNTTNNQLLVGLNNTQQIIPWVTAGTPANALCVTWLGTLGQLSAVACGSGGTGSGTVAASSQFSLPYYSLTGTNTTVSGVPSPTTNGVYQVIYNITGGAASAPQISLPGVTVRTNSAATDTILQSDRVSVVLETNASTKTITGPTLTGNIPFGIFNTSATLATYTPASGNVNNAFTQIIPANWFAFHYTDGVNAFMPVMPTYAAFPNATATPLFYNSVLGAFSTAILGVTGGGTGFSTATAHGLWVGEGTSSPAFVGPSADTVPLWQSASLDPIAASVPSCSGTTNALTYNTSSHVFGCNTIAGGGGAGGGQIDYPATLPNRYDVVGATLTAANTISNSNTATTILGSYVGTATVRAGQMIPSSFGTKTVLVHATGVLSTAGANFALNVTVSLGGVTLGSITVPTTAGLASTPWKLDYRFGVSGLTTATGGGCIEFVGASGAEQIGCATSGSITGLNFAADQLVDVKATWTTASASNVFTTNQADIAVEHANQ